MVLCRLALAIKPGSVKKVNPAKARFKMMENLGFFLNFCKEYGVPHPSLFHPLDLVERQYVILVLRTSVLLYYMIIMYLISTNFMKHGESILTIL